ncbi:SO2930 family diheme c-type cytochrome [Marinicauda pacifica]|uniref:SO2930 family diheme c-type cytochrome n=1 Tax=Marinicauda pacifica TaxID=1133559 RepID=UPI0035C84666
MRSARHAAGLVCALGAALLVLAACRGEAAAPRYHESANPEVLSQWGQLSIMDGRLVPGPGVLPYDLNTALFSDYAIKLRTVWLPDGAQPAGYDAQDSFDFPVGTVITKTFYYPRAGEGDGESFDAVARTRESLIHFEQGGLDLSRVRLIETRILVRREAGWDALPYVWDEDQREAHLSRSGAFVDLTLVDAGGLREPLSYMVPNVNQCANCHETDTGDGGIRPIGPAARHLNRDFDYAQGPANQLAEWRARGLLAGGPRAGEAPANTAWSGAMPLQAMLEPAARSYLDINCAHCHSRTGPADTSGLYLERAEPSGPNLGFCKPPIAAGRGTGGRRYSIIPGDAHASILVHRMESDRADIMMPELGRSIADREGVALVAAWIDSLAGSCEDA